MEIYYAIIYKPIPPILSPRSHGAKAWASSPPRPAPSCRDRPAAPVRQEEFEAAAEEAKVIEPEPEDEDKLQLYALFKQATVGDINTSAP